MPHLQRRRKGFELARHAVGSQRPSRTWQLNRVVKPWHFLSADFSAPDGNLYRLTNAKFDRMLRDPKGPVLPAFSEQRVRMARQVPFDVDDGLDLERLFQQQWDRAESSLDRSLDAPREPRQCSRRSSSVRRARSVEPSQPLMRALDDDRVWANRLSAGPVGLGLDTVPGRDSGRECTG